MITDWKPPREVPQGRLRDTAFRLYWTTSASPSFFLARIACFSVMTPAATMRSICLSFGICLSLAFALRIFWLDAGNVNL